MYLPFWVAIPVWLIWASVVLMFYMAIAAVWMMWAMIALLIAGVLALTRNPEAAHDALRSLDWTREGRRSRSVARTSSRSSSRRFRGRTKLPNGATWTCGHQHRTQSGADSCAQEAAREVMAGQPVSPAPVMPRNHCWYCGARKKDHDQAGNHPAPVVMPY